MVVVMGVLSYLAGLGHGVGTVAWALCCFLVKCHCNFTSLCWLLWAVGFLSPAHHSASHLGEGGNAPSPVSLSPYHLAQQLTGGRAQRCVAGSSCDAKGTRGRSAAPHTHRVSWPCWVPAQPQLSLKRGFPGTDCAASAEPHQLFPGDKTPLVWAPASEQAVLLSRRHKGAVRGGGLLAAGNGTDGAHGSCPRKHCLSCRVHRAGELLPPPPGSPGHPEWWHQGHRRELPLLPQPCTYTAGAGSAELGKEALAPERTAGTPIPGTAEETTGAPTEEQGGIPIPTASLLQVTERRRECSPCTSPAFPCILSCTRGPCLAPAHPKPAIVIPASQPLVPPWARVQPSPLRSHQGLCLAAAHQQSCCPQSR